MEKTKLTPTQKAVLRRWIRALRSGKYRQAKVRLRDQAGAMCCLGVLCDVIDPSGWKDDMYSGKVVEPPINIQQAAGIDQPASYFVEPSDFTYTMCSELMVYNNDMGWSFRRIATLLERRMLGVKPKRNR